MTAFQTFRARVVCTKPLSEFTKHIEFALLNVPRLGFVPGQWLSFKANTPDGEEITRAYSIASTPGNREIALCLNRVPNGFMSNFLCDLKPGEELSCQGPFGDFILRPPMRDSIFIATGTGIAPFRSMLLWLFTDPAQHQGKQLWLLFGNRTEGDIYYHDEFRRLAAGHPDFHYLPTLSRGSPGWTGLRGYVQDHVPGIVQRHPGMQAYICGLEKMVTANRELLKSLGWDRKSIHYEKYD